MLKAFTKLFDSNQKNIKRYQQTVDVINKQEADLQVLDDQALKAKTQEFKDRLASGETLDDILPEAFAESLGDQVILGAEVREIAQDQEGVSVSYLCDGETRTISGKAVILAVPALSLRTIQSTPAWPDTCLL